MQPDLPWNVAGIPPEAREAVRIAARREGMSVGEWLTRRILKGLTDGDEPDGWRQQTEYVEQREHMSGDPGRTPHDNGAVDNSHRPIHEKLESLTRRVEETERVRSQTGRAISQAAQEIHIATHEQVRAFDQLSAHVVALGARVARIENGRPTEAVKDAIMGLHAGLSRLADQFTQNSGHVATTIGALTGQVETLAQTIEGVRGDAENAARALARRISAFEEQEHRAERTVRASAEKLDSMVAGFVDAGSDEPGAESVDRIRPTFVAQLTETIDKMQARLIAGEAQVAGALARVEDQIARTESFKADAPLDRRLQGIEHTLTDIAGRLESTERTVAGATRAIDEDLRVVSARLDTAEKRYRDTFAELQAAARQTAPSSTPSTAPLASVQNPESNANREGDPPARPQPHDIAGDLRKPNRNIVSLPTAVRPAVAGDTALAKPLRVRPPETKDSFVEAVRRSAREAGADSQRAWQGSPDTFPWGASSTATAKGISAGAGASRFLVAAVIVVAATVAVVAGILLSHDLVRHSSTVFLFPAVPGHAVTGAHLPEKIAAAEPIDPAGTIGPARTEAPVSDAPASQPRLWHTKIDLAPAAVAANFIATDPPRSVVVPPPVSPPSMKPVSAVDRLIALADAGNADAELLIGLKYLDGDGISVNEAEAAKWLERASDRGEAIAAYRLGTLYERGHGVPADATKAVEYYGIAARLGNRRAMHNLAVAYADGTGAQRDLMRAAQWFSKAAALGLADSQFNLAVLYERGMGVQQSLSDAYKWYAIAAAQGDAESKVRLDIISSQMSSDDCAAAQKAAADFHSEPLDRKSNAPPEMSSID